MAAKLKLAIGLLVAAVVFAGASGWLWVSAAVDDDLSYAQSRDDALAAGRQQIAELNSLDHHRVDEGIGRWLEVSTGKLHDELARTDEATRKSLREGGTVATGKVLDAAVNSLDDHTGTARLLASVEITVAKEGAATSTKRNRFSAQLTRTEAGWKVSAMDQVPIGAG
ncbi:hypothetical protein [Amycolatopsis magusensis]|uniref:hypothetical protein n=1 Tax=Amycolatopsis magusensis TaxID=882444 RepID=UPI0024A80F17|nr:hypothetical protein [Amycolatopsis magusensis]MDI5978340.1 hypothetical protein [Amycolatopsis magusensis]UJW35905.1 hypothetical protein L3Q67_20175 [Saccharothrix sp. AJ9571]